MTTIIRMVFIAFFLGIVSCLQKEQNIYCKDRDAPFVNYINSTSIYISTANSITLLSKIDQILICGTYENTKGVIMGTDTSGNTKWTYSLYMPCVYIFVDEKESSINSILFQPGYGLEVHSYNASNALNRFFMYELQDQTITQINDATISGDFNWVLVTKSDNTCIIIMITKIRRKNYLCSNNLSLKSFRFVSSDPILIGSDSSNIVYRENVHSFAKPSQVLINFDRSEGPDCWVYCMFLYDSNDSTDTSDCMMVLSTLPNNYVLVVIFSSSDGSVQASSQLDFSMTNVKINYSEKGKDHVISGYITSTNQLVVMRFDNSTFIFGDLRLTTANNQANFLIVPGSVLIDEDANILMGGNIKALNLMIYKAGEELSLYSSIYYNSTRKNSDMIAKEEIQITQSNSYIKLTNNNANSNWDNKTGRVFGYDSTVYMSKYYTPLFNSHWIKSKYNPNRYTMKFNNICNGSSKSLPTTDDYNISLTVIKRTDDSIKSSPYLKIKDNMFEFVTRNLDDGDYLFSLKVADPKSSIDYAVVSFEYEVEKSIYYLKCILKSNENRN